MVLIKCLSWSLNDFLVFDRIQISWKKGSGERKFQIVYFWAPKINTERLCVFLKLVLLNEFRVKHWALNHAKPLLSLENLVLYVPVIANCIAAIQQSVLLLLNEVRQVVILDLVFLFVCLRDGLNKLLYLWQSLKTSLSLLFSCC